MAQIRAAATKSSPSSSARRTKPTAKRSSKSQPAAQSTHKNGHCWPGFEPVAGKKAGTKGSCKRVPGKHSAQTRRATKRFAAASKLEKQGKPNPKS
jgi:hypothetical protein